jgi:hypothetical protein
MVFYNVTESGSEARSARPYPEGVTLYVDIWGPINSSFAAHHFSQPSKHRNHDIQGKIRADDLDIVFSRPVFCAAVYRIDHLVSNKRVFPGCHTVSVRQAHASPCVPGFPNIK